MQSSFLVFTSAGENANIKYWLSEKNFDVWVTYYGDTANKYKDLADYYVTRKGAKFANLLHAYHENKNLFEGYEYILVTDDDIKIRGKHINQLFNICKHHDLWLGQSAFLPNGKISHGITRKRPFSWLRYTNFIEVTCPIFRVDKLKEFLAVYDGRLAGYGIDWWFLEVLNPPANKIAIIDYYPCINPFDIEKNNIREINTLEDLPARRENWKKIKIEKNINRDLIGTREYKRVYNLKSVLYGIIRIDYFVGVLFKRLTKSINKKVKGKR